MPNSSITARDRRRWSPANLYGRGISSKTQIISVTDLLCEGPIEGLENLLNNARTFRSPGYPMPR